MYYSYDILCSVNFLHGYFPDGRIMSFEVKPSAGTAEQMKKAGLLGKSQPGSFSILYDNHYAGRERLKQEVLNSDIVLDFYIINNDPLLFSHTAGLEDYLPNKSCFLFTNETNNKDNRLHVKEYAGSEDMYPNGRPVPRMGWQQPFGVIRLTLNKITGSNYHISFDVKTTYWQYILVSDESKELQQPAILDKANKIIFSGPSSVILPDETERIAFTSQSRLPLNCKPDVSFRLVENYNAGNGKHKVVLSQLPYPDVRRFSAIGKLKKKESHSDYSYIII